jgi:hypothetical protein
MKMDSFPTGVAEIISARGWDEETFDKHFIEFLEGRVENYDHELGACMAKATADDVAGIDASVREGSVLSPKAFATVEAILLMDNDKMNDALLAMGREKIDNFDAEFVEYLQGRSGQENTRRP